MVKNVDYEVILGAKKDRDFGSIILFGMGGIGVEIFEGLCHWPSPAEPDAGKKIDGGDTRLQNASGIQGQGPC